MHIFLFSLFISTRNHPDMYISMYKRPLSPLFTLPIAPEPLNSYLDNVKVA